MNRIKMGALLIISALSIGAIGSAALSSISFDRTVNAGQIKVDTDQNVAVQFTNTSNYAGLIKTDSNGKVTLNLNEAINNNSSVGYNTDALFTVGSASKGVIKIKNNSDVAVAVSMTNDTKNANAVTITPASGSSSTIGSGSSADFYFTINTNGQEALKTMNAVLHVQDQ